MTDWTGLDEVFGDGNTWRPVLGELAQIEGRLTYPEEATISSIDFTVTDVVDVLVQFVDEDGSMATQFVST